MYLVFDVETNGFPKKDSSGMLIQPRITQLAWLLLDSNFNVMHTRCDLIKPEGWEIPKEHFFIEAGHSTERNEELGIDLDQAINEFIWAINNCEVMIAHNARFDVPVVVAEMNFLGKKADKKPAKICTMLSTIDFCAIVNSKGYKWPTLDELHNKLFGEGFDGAHDALADVSATARCFIELAKRKVEFVYL